MNKPDIKGAKPERLYYYAKRLIKGRWPEAEPVIAKQADWAYCYAVDVIKTTCYFITEIK